MEPSNPVEQIRMKHGVAIGQIIDFHDARVIIIGAYPGQVRCRFEELDPKTREPTGRTRTKTIARSRYDGWIRDSRPGPMPKPAGNGAARRVKIMRASASPGAVTWEDAEFEKLAANDVFVVIEADGTEVPGGPWMTRGPAYRYGDGWTVDCDALDMKPSLGDPNLVL